MRDQRYVAVHRGGPLCLEHHRLLAAWAADCVEHVLPLFTEQYPHDTRPQEAINIARAWARGEITVGAARAAATVCHAAAREVDEPAQFVARAAGHAVATAHMADHAPGVPWYLLKSVKAAADKANSLIAARQEHEWQKAQLPDEIRELVLSTFAAKYHNFGM